MLINNIIKNLQYMFSKCDKLKDINELKYLNTKYSKIFENIFDGCISLTNIKGFKNGMCQIIIIVKICSMNVNHQQILKNYKSGMYQMLIILEECL